MFAVVRTGGKQYRVAAGDKIVVERIPGNAGDTVQLGDVLLAGEGAELRSTDGLTIAAEIIAQAKGEKVIVFKKRRRHNYRRKKGHRQQHTILRILAIGGEQAKTKKTARTDKASEEAAGAPEPQAPLKGGDTGSEMTDAPAKRSRKSAAAPDAEAKPQAPIKAEGAESEMTDSPAAAKRPRKTSAKGEDKK